MADGLLNAGVHRAMVWTSWKNLVHDFTATYAARHDGTYERITQPWLG